MQFANDTFHPFGWDEISWFSHQPSAYRSYFLRYAAGWLAANDPKGHFEMPFERNLCDSKFNGRSSRALSASRVCAPRTLNAIGPLRVTLSLR